MTTALYLLAIFIVLILVAVMFIILKTTVKKINTQTKQYFVDKLQEYDYMIDNKLNKLNEINEELKEKELKREEQDTSTSSRHYDFDYQIIDLLNKTEYQDKNIFELNKEIENKFKMDYESLIKKFLEHIDDDGRYQFCINLKEKFTSEEIYKLKIMLPDEQEEYLKKLLNEKELEIYNIYCKLEKKPNIEGFLDYINELIDLNNPNITIYVGKKDENYDHLSKYIKTIYSKDIYRGIKIIYQKRIYDYSLNERNV